MKCEQVRELLSPYIDSMTSEKENKFINAHLENCSQCQSELEHLRSFCVALKNLSTPELPERFAEDFRKRLTDEKSILFGHREIKKPKKHSWIAASVAGVALVLGIYASTALPIAPMIASWQDKHNKENDKKPTVAINEIINRIYPVQEEENPVGVAQALQETPKETRAAGNTGSRTTSDNTGEQKKPGENKVEPSVAQVVTPKVADVFSTRLKVQNASESLKEVVQLAQNNGWNYEYTDNGSVSKALSGPNANGLAIKVNENDVDKVINILGGVGKASAPTHNRVELTQQYSEVEKQISALQAEKQNLQQTESPDQAKLNNIERQIQDNLKQKAALDKELQMVTVNIYFVEEVNP